MVRCLPLFTFLLTFITLTGLKANSPSLKVLPGHKRDTVVIGILVNEETDNVLNIQAAQIAIDQANTESNKQGLIFRLETRRTDGPWGQASKKAVELIYDEKAVAIVGVLDGRTAHLAEQVATRSHTPYIETKATDPTLSKAFVPWFFQIVHNDQQVAEALVSDIYADNIQARVAVLYEDNYDEKMALSSLQDVVKSNKLNAPISFVIGKSNQDQIRLSSELSKGEFQAIILLTDFTKIGTKVLDLLNESGAQIYYTQSTGTSKKAHQNPFYSLSHIDDESGYIEFRNIFLEKYNTTPSDQSIYIYDAINLLAHSIREIGIKPIEVGNYIGTIQNHRGLTGLLEFDNLGRLVRRPQLKLMK